MNLATQAMMDTALDAEAKANGTNTDYIQCFTRTQMLILLIVKKNLFKDILKRKSH